jgi:hypothetical protein
MDMIVASFLDIDAWPTSEVFLKWYLAVVGIVPSPSQVVPQCEEITTIHFFIQIFNV